jgi:hypothetical protein
MRQPGRTDRQRRVSWAQFNDWVTCIKFKLTLEPVLYRPYVLSKTDQCLPTDGQASASENTQDIGIVGRIELKVADGHLKTICNSNHTPGSER